MELLIVIMLLGLGTYWLIRHPIKSMKMLFAIVGIFLLGTLMLFLFGIITFTGLSML